VRNQRDYLSTVLDLDLLLSPVLKMVEAEYKGRTYKVVRFSVYPNGVTLLPMLLVDGEFRLFD